MSWFKHYCSASDGDSLNRVYDKFGHSGYACWFIFLEIYSKAFYEKPGERLVFHKSVLRLRFKLSYTKVQLYLDYYSELQMISFSFDGSSYEIKVCNFVKYMNTDVRKIRRKREAVASGDTSLTCVDKIRLDKISKIDKSILPKVENSKNTDTSKSNGVKPSESETTKQTTKQKKPRTDEEISLTVKTSEYCNLFKIAYKMKYGTTYTLTQAERGRIKYIVNSYPIDKFQTLVTSYLKMNDQYFIKKAHDVFTFIGNLPKINNFSESGKMITSKEAEMIEKTAHSNKELDPMEMKKLEIRRHYANEPLQPKQQSLQQAAINSDQASHSGTAKQIASN